MRRRKTKYEGKPVPGAPKVFRWIEKPLEFEEQQHSSHSVTAPCIYSRGEGVMPRSSHPLTLLH